MTKAVNPKLKNNSEQTKTEDDQIFPHKEATNLELKKNLEQMKIEDNQIFCQHKEEVCFTCKTDYSDINLIGRAFRANQGYLPPPNPALSKQITDLKAQGNEFFKQKDYDSAISAYSKAISACRMRPVWDPPALVNEEVTVLLSNRAACFLEKAFFVNALYDAEIVTRIRPTWPKGFFRKGRALMGLGRYAEAVDAFERALAADPASKEIRDYLDEALQEI